MKYLFLLFTLILFSCEKENFEEMKQAEKILYKQLTTDEILKKGSVSFSVETKYYIIICNSPFTSYTKTETTWQDFQAGAKNYINLPLFGFSDMQSNFKNSRYITPLIQNNSALISGDERQPFKLDNFFVLKDNIDLNCYYIHPNKVATEIQNYCYSYNIANSGDLVLINFLYPHTFYLPDNGIYQAETKISMYNFSYIYFCELLNSEKITIKELFYDFSNRQSNYLNFKTNPEQAEQNIYFINSNIYAQNLIDSINIKSYLPNNNYNIQKVTIPLSKKTKDLTVSIPIAYNIKKHLFSVKFVLNQ